MDMGLAKGLLVVFTDSVRTYFADKARFRAQLGQSTHRVANGASWCLRAWAIGQSLANGNHLLPVNHINSSFLDADLRQDFLLLQLQ